VSSTTIGGLLLRVSKFQIFDPPRNLQLETQNPASFPFTSMPIHNTTPREITKRQLLFYKESDAVSHDIDELRALACMRTSFTVLSCRRRLGGAAAGRKTLRRHLLEASALFALMEDGWALLQMHRKRTPTKGPIKRPGDFTLTEFVEQFRLRKSHFWEVLGLLRTSDGLPMMEEGRPRLLTYGKPGHYGHVWADQAFMVFLRRMATPSRWVDLQYILGGSRSTLSAVFNMMVTELYVVYSPLVCDLHKFKHLFPRFAAHLRQRGCPFDNLVFFIDGHFQPTCRPGGEACVNLNLEDFQTFAGKERLHGLKYQAAVLPNGMALVWGPWRGVFHDATMFARSGILGDMEEIAVDQGQDFCGFGDSAYPLHRFLHRILKGPATGEGLTAWERRYNALMARFRIIVENVFAVCEQYWGILRDRKNLRLGNMCVSKIFPLAILFYNIRTILYGNNIVGYMGENVLMDLSLEEYLAVARD